MLTLTVVTRPLLSDPLVHMVCGGSCDQFGRRSTNETQEDCPGVDHEAAYFFGDITSKSDPDKYIQMATQLLQRYNSSGYGSTPLLINTGGWVKSLGYEILSAIVDVADPGHIIQVMGNTKMKSFDMSAHGSLVNNGFSEDYVVASPNNGVRCRQYENSATLIHVTPAFDNFAAALADGCSVDGIGSVIGSLNPVTHAADHRAHRLCIYFLGGYEQMANLRSPVPREEEIISFHQERGLCDPYSIIGRTLAAAAPYAVPFGAVRIHPSPSLMDGLTDLQWDVPGDEAPSELLDSLNGSVVGLCFSPDSVNDLLSNTNAGTGVPALNCAGLGIVRTVDYGRRLFFVLTPVHPRVLARVTSFVGGSSVSLPLDCVYRGVHSDSFPFLSSLHTHPSSTLDGGTMRNRNTKKGTK